VVEGSGRGEFSFPSCCKLGNRITYTNADSDTQIHDAEDALGEASHDDESDSGTSDDDFSYILGWKTSITASSHPPTNAIHQLWQSFVENVNPLTKIVHVPSLQPAIEKAVADIEHIPKGFEALMFAIYSMAVLSLTEDECKETLGESRGILLTRYVAATKVALSRAKFMSSTSIVVMQALVLHILSVRGVYESRAVWNLTGLAIRVAEGMGMRLDGTLLGLSPFETEIRRRIWWQLKMHDFRAAELCGQAKFRDFELDETTPKKPANVNDSDLYPSMKHAPAESTGPTEMIWCAIRSELSTFAVAHKAKVQKLGKVAFTSEEFAAMDDLKIKDGFIAEIEELMETKFLRFCDPSDPLHYMVSFAARCATDLIRFIAHHPRRWTNMDQVPAAEEQLVWKLVLQLLERYNMMQSSPQLQHFAWNVPYFIQWHAVIHVLDTLRIHPLHTEAEKAWHIIDKLYEYNSDMLLSTKWPIFVAVGNLCLKAFGVRAAALKKNYLGCSNPPEYIIRLQGQRKRARERREVGLTKRNKHDELGGQKILPATVSSATFPDTNITPSDALAEVHSLQYPIGNQPEISIQGSTRIGDDAFWLGDAPGDNLVAVGAPDMMNLNMDVIMSQDYWLDTPNDEVIDWAQWDAWFGNIGSSLP
jgi:hypothetical protein